MMYCMMLQCVLWELLLLLKWSSKNLRKFMAFRVGGPHSGLRRHWLLPLPVYCYQYCYHYHYHYCNNNNHNNNNLVTPAARSWAVQYSQNYHTINLKIQHELLSILMRRRTEDTREMVFPFQHLAIALQKGECGRLPGYKRRRVISCRGHCFCFFYACGFVLVGQKIRRIKTESCQETNSRFTYDRQSHKMTQIKNWKIRQKV